ncbi:MAG: hypothetical protein RUMPE_00350 [Eubacteriales bacterium SKADARSKE-1]|nr:hypothetical protein [Eubacteriales bacterium SKADARSKE-1]
MSAIIKREISAYFSSAVGYVIMAIFFTFGGFYFYETSLVSNSANLSYTFSNLFIITIFLVPILTMRLFSEEKKQKTDQALFTSPISLFSVTASKFLSAVLMFLICMSITFFYAIAISFFTVPNWGTILGNFLGLFLLGSALISIGLFLSSITENQIVAAISGFGVGIFILLFETIAKVIPIEFISNIFSSLSFMSHYNNFTMGVINLVDIVFFISVCLIFNFLTLRVFEKKRWA